MRAVRNPARMQCDRTTLDAAARTEIATHVKEDLIGFDVVVHPRNPYRFWMGIEHARRESADNVASNLERLVDWRRLMYRAGDRLEILRIECERIKIPIPADRIEGMMRKRHMCPTRAVLHQNIDVFLFVDGNDFGGPMQVSLRIRRAHLDLAFVIQIALRNPDRAGRLENELIFLFNFVRHQSISNSSRDHDVIFRAITQFTENAFQCAAAMKDK